MPIEKIAMMGCGLVAITALVVGLHAQGPAAGGAKHSTTGDKQSALAAQGKARFQAYKCYDCHGQIGEGTDEAPDLTHSKLTAEQVSKFLQKPSADAQNKGMPDVPADSPDHQPLVAYVMSLRATRNASSGTGASTPASKPATAKGATGRPAATGRQSALVAQGKARFQAYKCYDCHGQNGEGTDEAPDLTHSKLAAEQVSKFLENPSVDAQNKGMPDVPADSPDHQPLVAYVMSLRAK